MNTSIIINENDLNEAKTYCAGFSDIKTGNWAMGANFAAVVAEKFFEGSGKDVDIKLCLRNVEIVAKEYEISDIYLNGNYIDVRVYFGEEDICVPKKHFENEIAPVAYMFVKVQQDLSQAEVTGFIIPDTLAIVGDSEEYYPINENALVPFEEIEYMFNNADDLFDIDEEEIYSAIDDKSMDVSLVRKMLRSFDGRRRFIKAYLAQNVFEQVLLQDSDDVASENEPDFLEQYVDSEENSLYNFETVVSPNLKENVELTEFETEDVASDNDVAEVILTEEQDSSSQNDNYDNMMNENVAEADQEEIDTLFDGNSDVDQTKYINKKSHKSNPVLLAVLVILLISAGVYYGYTKFTENSQMPAEQPQVVQEQEKDSMPNETVEKNNKSEISEEGDAVSVPAIEQNLDASILVSNLKVDWEVPAGYVSNTQAKRYLIKLGKIIQLNLKTELLLLSRPPITNKISVELKYNPSSHAFETVGIIASSGEKTVDDLIMQIVQKALSSKIDVSTESFSNLPGNPVLVIRL